jgi:hypothetical protein
MKGMPTLARKTPFLPDVEGAGGYTGIIGLPPSFIIYMLQVWRAYSTICLQWNSKAKKAAIGKN